MQSPLGCSKGWISESNTNRNAAVSWLHISVNLCFQYICSGGTLTYLLTPWSRVLLEQLASLQLVKEIPRVLCNPKLTHRTHKRPPPVPILSQPNPVLHPTSWRSILILSSHLRLGLPSGLFPSGFPTSTLYTPLPSPIRATCISLWYCAEMTRFACWIKKLKYRRHSLCWHLLLFQGDCPFKDQAQTVLFKDPVRTAQ